MESLEDLLSYQRDLNQEEEYLTKLILQIDEQINRLQVEQMELQSSMFDGSSAAKETKSSETQEDRTNEELDLSVPVNIKNVIEQETEDEEEEEEGEHLK